MSMTQRLTAEFVGTFWLVFGGCGSAVLAAAFPELGIGFAGVSLAFGLTPLVSPSHEPFEDAGARIVFIVTIALATLLSAALIFFAGRRRNWARWGLLILVALSWIEGLFAAQGLPEDAFPTVVNAVSTVLDTVSVWLLFSGQAVRWFRN